ncbi:MAG: DoxX-like family protein [Leptospiraceae bacterium]|nr:DoxX-like family protein [Leptospiraceae bacterium]
MEIKVISLYAMAVFFAGAGIAHFIITKFFLRIMPPYIPWHKPIVYLSGLAEIGLAVLLLIPAYSVWAAWGIIALLVAVFPANLYHFTSGGAGMRIPKWALFMRLPLQILLIAWAWWHTR